MPDVLLAIDNLTVAYRSARGLTKAAVDGISLEIKQGEAMGLVGESGCGKSSTARAVMRFIAPASGRVLLNGRDLLSIGNEELKKLRPKFQMIFQDSLASFNPQRPIGAAIAMPLKLMGIKSRAERRLRTRRMMARVGLEFSLCDRFPHQLSGGQCQRAQIARALITGPELLICDEPVSSLDVLIQAQILDLLHKLQKDNGLSMLFISHDLAVVKEICDRVAVMYAGGIREVAACQRLFQAPRHPYARDLLRAIPKIGGFKNELAGSGRAIESPFRSDPGPGCSYRRHCCRVAEKCFLEAPALTDTTPGAYVACHFPLEIENGRQ